MAFKNALIQDQILTMRKGTLNVCVLKGDRLSWDVDREEVKLNAPVESLLSTTYNLVFTHPEVVVDNIMVFKFQKPHSYTEDESIIVVDFMLIPLW